MATTDSIPTYEISDLSLEYNVANQSQMEAAADWATSKSFSLTPHRANENRHQLRARVQSQNLKEDTPRASQTAYYDGSDVVVIAFDGTATFEPRRASILQAAAQRLRDQGLRVDGSFGSLSSKVDRALADKTGRDIRWSGTGHGPMESLIRHPELSENTQWFSFPSEEMNILSGAEAFESTEWGDILRDATHSYTGETENVNGALKTLNDILAQAKQQGKNPRFVLLSHSSGGTSLVKFLEKAASLKDTQGQPLQFSAALTIDPVREAHEAVFEGAGEYILKGAQHKWNDALEFLGLPQRPVSPPAVQSQIQPETLYAPSNVDTFLNFYQRKDTQGMKFGPQVGIQGSPVVGAVNREISDVGTGGHGEIALDKNVESAFLRIVKNARAFRH